MTYNNIKEGNEESRGKYLIQEFNKKDIIYDGKVRKTTGGTGIIHIPDKYLGKRAYVVFPIERKNVGGTVSVAIDEILNKGIRPGNSHSSHAFLEKKYVGRKCLAVVMED